VRVGLSETKHFAEGYEAIFGKQSKKSSRKRAAPKTRVRKKARKK
jgi:hypothetical protein